MEDAINTIQISAILFGWHQREKHEPTIHCSCYCRRQTHPTFRRKTVFFCTATIVAEQLYNRNLKNCYRRHLFSAAITGLSTLRRQLRHRASTTPDSHRKLNVSSCDVTKSYLVATNEMPTDCMMVIYMSKSATTADTCIKVSPS